MPRELISGKNITEGFEQTWIFVNEQTGGVFMKFNVIFSIWLIIGFAIYNFQRRFSNSGDLPSAMAFSGVATVVFTFMLRLIPGLIDGITVSMAIMAAVLGILWFVFSRPF